jgi:hypothetical protein
VLIVPIGAESKRPQAVTLLASAKIKRAPC